MAIAIDPVCGMEVDTATSDSLVRVRGHDLLVLRHAAACSSSRTTRRATCRRSPTDDVTCAATAAISRS